MSRSVTIVCTLPPFCWGRVGGGGEFNLQPNFQKGGGDLKGPQLLKGVAGNEEVTVFRGDGGVQFSHKK